MLKKQLNKQKKVTSLQQMNSINDYDDTFMAQKVNLSRDTSINIHDHSEISRNQVSLYHHDRSNSQNQLSDKLNRARSSKILEFTHDGGELAKQHINKIDSMEFSLSQDNSRLFDRTPPQTHKGKVQSQQIDESLKGSRNSDKQSSNLIWELNKIKKQTKKTLKMKQKLVMPDRKHYRTAQPSQREETPKVSNSVESSFNEQQHMAQELSGIYQKKSDQMARMNYPDLAQNKAESASSQDEQIDSHMIEEVVNHNTQNTPHGWAERNDPSYLQEMAPSVGISFDNYDDQLNLYDKHQDHFQHEDLRDYRPLNNGSSLDYSIHQVQSEQFHTQTSQVGKKSSLAKPQLLIESSSFESGPNKVSRRELPPTSRQSSMSSSSASATPDSRAPDQDQVKRGLTLQAFSRNLQKVFRTKKSKREQTAKNSCEQNLKELKDRVNQEKSLSVLALKNHIRQNHPKKNNEQWWPLCKSPGALFKLDQNGEMPEFITDIGLGPAIYLLILKALSKLFLILTILNLPALFIFYQGTESQDRQLSGLTWLLTSFSLGNIGEKYTGCSTVSLSTLDEEEGNQYMSFPISCKSGRLKKLLSYGLMKDDKTQQCDSEMMENYEDKCNSKIESEFRTTLQERFQESCPGKQNCKIRLNHFSLNQECADRISQKENPRMTVQYFCDMTKVTVAISQTEVSKSTVANVIVFCDILSMLVVLIFVNALVILIDDFAIQFDSETVEMRDFTVEINNLPMTFRAHKDEVSMKFAIWAQIQERISDAKEARLCPADLDSTIVEINFGVKNYLVLNKLIEIDKICYDLELQNIKLSQETDEEEKENISKEIKRIHQKLESKHDQYVEKFNNKSVFEAIQVGQDQSLYNQIVTVYITFLTMDTRDLIVNKLFRSDSQLPRELRKLYGQRKYKKKGAMNQALVKNIKIRRQSVHITQIQNQQLDLEYSKTGEQFQKAATKKQEPVSITLSDIQNQPVKPNVGEQTPEDREQQVKNLKEKLKQKLRIDVNQEKDRIQSELKTQDTCDPEYIQWENFGYSQRQRMTMQGINMILALIIVIITSILMQELQWNQYLAENRGVKDCKNTQTSLLKAQLDVNKMMADQTTIAEAKVSNLKCFCLNNLVEHYFNIREIRFPDGQKHCQHWYDNYQQNIMKEYTLPIIVVIINQISTQVFNFTAKFEHQISTARENQSIFYLIFFQSFCTIGIILIFTDYESSRQDFSTEWFVKTGTTLTRTMLVETVTTKFSDLIRIIVDFAMRFRDRDYTMELYKQRIDEPEEFYKDLPNTKQLRQFELNNLYTGSQITIGQKFAQVYTFIFVSLTYSSGMPLLYPITALYFLITYWIDKICLMRYYQKTKVFNVELPQSSSKLLKYAVILHLIFSTTILSSNIFNYLENKKDYFSQSDKEEEEEVGSAFAWSSFLIMMIFLIICLIGYLVQIYVGDYFNKMIINVVTYLKQRQHARDIRIKIRRAMALRMQHEKHARQKMMHRGCEDLGDDPVNCHMDAEIEELKKQESRIHNAEKCCAFSFNFKNSTNLYSELLFDFLDTYFANILDYEILVNKKLDEINRFPQKSSIPANKSGLFKQYCEEFTKKKFLIKKQIDIYNDTIVNEINQIKQKSLVKLINKSQTSQMIVTNQIFNFVEQQNTESSKEESSQISSCDHHHEGGDQNLQQSLDNSLSYSSQSFQSSESNFLIKKDANIHATNQQQNQPKKQIILEAKDQIQKQKTLIKRKGKQYANEDQEYLKKLDYLNLNLDENELHAHYFKQNFRCASLSQSYLIMDNPKFNQVDGALDRAKILIKYPFLFTKKEQV